MASTTTTTTTTTAEMRLPSSILRGVGAQRSLHASALRRVPLVLNPTELKALAKDNVVPIDVSWHMPAAPRNAEEEYQTGPRIVGARRLDLDKVAALGPERNPLGLTHMLPSATEFRTAAKKLGVTPDSHVVLYDTQGVFSAPRGAYTFKLFGHDKVSILDGGLPRWIAEGGAVDVGPPEQFTGDSNLSGPEHNTWVRSYEDMVANAGKGEAGDVVLDARALGRYTGEAPEPRPGLPSGHIPHSLPLPFNDLLEQPTEDKPYTHLKSPAELKKILVDAVGGDKVWDEVNQPGGRQLVLTCGSGMTAAVLWLAQQIVAEAEGRAAPLASIYDESWTGYAQREDAPIETGDPTQK